MMRKYRKSKKAAKNVLTESPDLFIPQKQGKSGLPYGSNLNNNPYTIQHGMGGAPMLQRVISPAVLKQGKKTLKSNDTKPFIPGKYYKFITLTCLYILNTNYAPNKI